MEKASSETKVSIIVPVYNVENYLKDCLDSLIGQSFYNLEILLIDDGSSDDSGLICDAYANKDDRIKVFHVENGGVSRARNIGIDNANGRYITFIDADDWLFPDTVKNLYEALLKDKSEYAASGVAIYENGVVKDRQFILYAIPGIRQATDKRIALINHLTKSHLISSVSAKMFLKEKIESIGLKFNENIRKNEDILFNLEYLVNINNISICDTLGYYYRQHFQSVTAAYEKDAIKRIEVVSVEKRRILNDFKDQGQHDRTVALWKINEGLNFYKRCLFDSSHSDFKVRRERTNYALKGLRAIWKEESEYRMFVKPKQRHFISAVSFFCANIMLLPLFHIKNKLDNRRRHGGS